MPNSTSVFDSWGLLAFLQDEPAAARVEHLIWQAHESRRRLLISSVNLGEVWYSIARRRTGATAEEKVSEVLNMGFQVVSSDWSLAHDAAQFKARYRLSYADCFAAALAKREAAPLVTGDPEFKALESEIKVHWL